MNKSILDFFLEGLFDVKNYHMLLLNLIYLNTTDAGDKERMIKSVLGSITVLNKNIMILILLLYNLLVNSSYNIFENKFKNILINLLSQKPITQTNDESNDNDNSRMIDMSEPLDINNFVSINNQSVKKIKLSNSSNSLSPNQSSMSLKLSAEIRS